MTNKEIQSFIDGHPITYDVRLDFNSGRQPLHGFFHADTEANLKDENRWRFVSNILKRKYWDEKISEKRIAHTDILDGNDIKSINALVKAVK